MSRASICPTWASISPEMRLMSPEAAEMRSVSTWNCVAMVVPSVPAAPGGATSPDDGKDIGRDRRGVVHSPT
ncbi:hypothetical protein GCM10011314_21610 [Knoellia flava]|uniref:Uncharacterized protein n=1 Tax=Knoellia flava TaxID=913969 RepID=A0A8H9FW24_9MICO|nr:hypothetical protein GCM10011314_21610 [Knoellia flava]